MAQQTLKLEFSTFKIDEKGFNLSFKSIFISFIWTYFGWKVPLTYEISENLKIFLELHVLK